MQDREQHINLWVLIETSWNVKLSCIKSSSGTCSVLIETSWNVKWSKDLDDQCGADVLIETSWNVKVQVETMGINWH